MWSVIGKYGKLQCIITLQLREGEGETIYGQLSKKRVVSVHFGTAWNCNLPFLFFIKACPLVAFDVDDWITMGNFRLPVPIWKGAEAARVMPEVLMPVAGWIAARVIYPVCGDYTYSVTVISAVILTFLIITMCICLQKFLVIRFRLASNTAVALEIMFLVLFL